jgi:hypothetical protein
MLHQPKAMRLRHSGFAPFPPYFFLNGQKTHPISTLEGDDAQTLIIFTSLLDYAGPCARHFFCPMAF